MYGIFLEECGDLVYLFGFDLDFPFFVASIGVCWFISIVVGRCGARADNNCYEKQ